MTDRVYDNRVCDRLKVASWILEFLELLITIIILGITGSAADGMKNDLLFPNIPGKLSYNIAVAVITMIILLVLFVLDVSYRSNTSTWYRWNHKYRPWPRVSLNILFVALWIGCIASSFYTCSDLCSASGNPFAVIQYATLCCDCSTDSFSGVCSSLKPRGLEQRSGRYEATEGLDCILVVFFIASTFVVGAFHWVWEFEEMPESMRLRAPDHGVTNAYGETY